MLPDDDPVPFAADPDPDPVGKADEALVLAGDSDEAGEIDELRLCMLVVVVVVVDGVAVDVDVDA